VKPSSSGNFHLTLDSTLECRYWDGSRLTGEEWNKTLGINRTAWDVYFLYGSGSQWDGAAPAPSFWMHQLGGVTKAPHLNKQEFENKVKELLASVK